MNGLPKDIKIVTSVIDEFGCNHWQTITLPRGTQIDNIQISYNGTHLAHIFPPCEPSE